jgi:hypothetical protein
MYIWSPWSIVPLVGFSPNTLTFYWYGVSISAQTMLVFWLVGGGGGVSSRVHEGVLFMGCSYAWPWFVLSLLIVEHSVIWDKCFSFSLYIPNTIDLLSMLFAKDAWKGRGLHANFFGLFLTKRAI